MTGEVTGYAALVSALALLVHALRSAIPAMVRAFEARAESARVDSETRAQIERDRRAGDDDLRARLTRCDEQRDEMHAEMGRLRGQLDALADELAELRRSMTAGHAR